MDIKLITVPYTTDLYGFSGTAVNHDYAAAGSKLMGRMWQVIRENNLKHKGINFWLYEGGENIFTGVELESDTDSNILVYKKVYLPKYVYGKHIGTYQLLKVSYQALGTFIQTNGLKPTNYNIEIYGHWNADETKMETELLLGVE